MLVQANIEREKAQMEVKKAQAQKTSAKSARKQHRQAAAAAQEAQIQLEKLKKERKEKEDKIKTLTFEINRLKNENRTVLHKLDCYLSSLGLQSLAKSDIIFAQLEQENLSEEARLALLRELKMHTQLEQMHTQLERQTIELEYTSFQFKCLKAHAGNMLCRSLLEKLCARYIQLHEKHKKPECTWPSSEDFEVGGHRRNRVSFLSFARHACDDGQQCVPGFPQPAEAKPISNLWNTLSSAIHGHEKVRGPIYIPVDMLDSGCVSILKTAAKHLNMPYEKVHTPWPTAASSITSKRPSN